MGLLICEPKATTHVSGTVLLDQQAAHSEAVTAGLKHGKGKDAHIVLAPQPSEDPNDPLNWNSLKKLRVMVITYFGVIVHGVVPNPILNAGIVQISTDLRKPPTDIALLSGYLLLTTGAAGPFASAFARKYGKRPIYLFSSIVGTIGVIIGETASGYSTLLAARVVQGVAVAAYEALSIATIGDLYFVHERGPRVSVILFILSSVSNFVGIVAGVITSNLGWRYNFHVMLPFSALQTILFVFFAPETMYSRKAIYDIDMSGSSDDLRELALKEAENARHIEVTNLADQDCINPKEKPAVMLTTQSTRKPKTFFQEMSIYNGSFVDDSILKMLIACPAILLNVGALYQIVTSGLVTAWYVSLAILTGVVFASPPYLLNSADIGYTSVGPFVGGLLGSSACFIIATPMRRWLTQKNAGIYEPEFCLLPILPGGLIMIAGLLGFGYGLENFDNIYLLSFIWGVALFGVSFIVTFSSQYALDAFRNNSTEIFIMNMVFKNFFFYGVTNYIIQWYELGGPVQIAGVLSGVTAILSLLTVPLYLYGKKYRFFWQHHNILKILHLETDHAGTE